MSEPQVEPSAWHGKHRRMVRLPLPSVIKVDTVSMLIDLRTIALSYGFRPGTIFS
jgi:hypothetical protein